jgi:hypothetical protein
VFGNSDNESSPTSQVAVRRCGSSRTIVAVTGAGRFAHYCRQCRAKLLAPVDNARQAFCSPGCHANFFRTRCRVCEGPIEQPARGGVRFTCNRAKCKRAWRAGLGFGRYHTPKNANSIQERPINTGSKAGVSDNRASSWRVIAAGAPISAGQYYYTTVGAADAIAAADRSNAAHWAANAEALK